MTCDSIINILTYSTMFKIVYSELDSSEFLGHVSFKIVSKSKQKLYLCYYTINNVQYNDPIFRMCKAYNDFCKDLDLFSQSHYIYLNIYKEKLDMLDI